NVCVESTLRDAFFLEYFPVLVEDAAWQAGPRELHTATVMNTQSFFGWGGNPTALAFGLSLLAAALLSRAWSGEGRPWRIGAMAGVLVLGALATHPTGALAGGTAFLVVIARSLAGRERPSSAALLTVSAVVTMAVAGALALYLGGPEISRAESDWVAAYQQSVERVLEGPKALFMVTIWPALPKVLGWPWVVMCLAASGALLPTSEGRKRLAWVTVSVVAIAALLALGPSIPKLGVLVYPLRFSPLLTVATVPLLGWALEGLYVRSRRAGQLVGAGVLVLAALAHGRFYQRAQPMATEHDLEAIRCLESQVPGDAVIHGAYGDATQWIPALTGRAITSAHPHISLNDEILARPPPAPQYLFVGERMRYGSAVEVQRPSTAPVCSAGESALYPLALK
ncbi:MAG: isochorismatase family protein, partial [Deltaproteobacteria bacterium]|nr:isochorismatase family protein [Deltaproteobacteria bacterium]